MSALVPCPTCGRPMNSARSECIPCELQRTDPTPALLATRPVPGQSAPRVQVDTSVGAGLRLGTGFGVGCLLAPFALLAVFYGTGRFHEFFGASASVAVALIVVGIVVITRLRAR